MKRLILIICATLLSPLAFADEQKQTLKILTWSDFFEPDAVALFEKKNNVKVQITTYHNEAMRLQLLKNSFADKFDLVVASYSSLNGLVSDKIIDKLNYSELPNYSNMDTEFLSQYDLSSHALIVSYSPLGIVYRKDKIEKPPVSWFEFINYPQHHHGRVQLIKHYEDLFDVYSLALRGKIERNDYDLLLQSAKHIDSNLVYLHSLQIPSESPDDQVMLGIAWMGITYGYSAHLMKEKDPNIGFYIPSEGTKAWIDTISVIRESENKKLAHSFLNFLMEPENAAKTQSFNLFATTNMKGQQYALSHPEYSKVAKSSYLIPDKNKIHDTSAEQEQFYTDKRTYFLRKLFIKMTSIKDGKL